MGKLRSSEKSFRFEEKRKKYSGSDKWIQSIVHDFVDMST